MIVITKAMKELTWDNIKIASEANMLDSIVTSGDLFPVELKSGEKVVFKATRDDKGKMFFVLDDCLDDTHYMNKRMTNKGGWAGSDMRDYLNKIVFNLLPDDLQAAIKPTKIIQVIDGERTECEDNLFLLSRTQVFGDYTEYEPEDSQLDIFKCEKDRVKECGDNGTWFWWLRSPLASSSSPFCSVYNAGSSNYYYGLANNGFGVAFGFSV